MPKMKVFIHFIKSFSGSLNSAPPKQRACALLCWQQIINVLTGPNISIYRDWSSNFCYSSHTPQPRVFLPLCSSVSAFFHLSDAICYTEL